MRTAELADWVWNDVSRKAAERNVLMALADLEDEGYSFGPVRFQVLPLGHERVPEPPEKLRGLPHLRMLLAHADVIGHPTAGGFLAELEPDDLERLRAITQRAYRKLNPGRTLPAWEVDEMIDRMGPEVALRELRKAGMH